MLDLKQIRRDPDGVRAALARRGPHAAATVDELLQLDERRRSLLPALEELRATQNTASERIAAAKRAGEDASTAIEAMKGVSTRAKEMQAEVAAVDEQLQAALTRIPNPPAASAADADEVVREVGEAGATGRDHLELLAGWVDMETGAKVSGSRFTYLRGPLVLLEFALVRWAMEVLMGKGFEPAITPVLVREEALYGTGFLPDTEQQIYHLPEDGLYLAGTSEVPLAGLHGGEIVDEADLPLRYAGFSTCFRREAGAAGKDTRGIFRVHQFDKVEMYAYVRPEDSEAEHERLLGIEEEMLQALGIPYRVVNIAVDDLGASAAKKYDLEAWLPGQGRFRELTSCSNTTDFQARRLDARLRPAGGGGTRHLHTLNGTAVAVGRTIIALAENHQRDDGSVAIPEVLQGFGAPAEIRPRGV